MGSLVRAQLHLEYPRPVLAGEKQPPPTLIVCNACSRAQGIKAASVFASCTVANKVNVKRNSLRELPVLIEPHAASQKHMLAAIANYTRHRINPQVLIIPMCVLI
jgi:hypothetical protein